MLKALPFVLLLLPIIHGEALGKARLSASNGSSTDSLAYLGAVDGKYFFADNDHKSDWSSAKEYCANANMQMITFTSATQVGFIVSKIGNGILSNNWYWTSAIETDTAERFVWSQNMSRIDANLISIKIKPPINFYLGFYTGNSSTGLAFQAYTGSYELYVLCEIS